MRFKWAYCWPNGWQVTQEYAAEGLHRAEAVLNRQRAGEAAPKLEELWPAVDLVLEVLDALVAHDMYGTARSWAEHHLDDPLWGALPDSRRSRDLLAVLVVLGEPPTDHMIPSELLHGLIADDCQRAAALLVLDGFMRRPQPLSDAPLTDHELACLILGFRAAVTTFSETLLRAFYPTISEVLRLSALPIDRSDSLSELNEIAGYLIARCGAIRFAKVRAAAHPMG